MNYIRKPRIKHDLYVPIIGRDEDYVEMFCDGKKLYSYFLDVQYVGMLKKLRMGLVIPHPSF